MQKTLILTLFFMLMQATGFTQNYQDLDSFKHQFHRKTDSNRVWQLVSIVVTKEGEGSTFTIQIPGL